MDIFQQILFWLTLVVGFVIVFGAVTALVGWRIRQILEEPAASPVNAD